MLPTTLHFLNGDATKYIFDQSTIEGDTAVIRETFCLGPLGAQFDDFFWDKRKAWFKQQYFVSADGYQNKVLDEFHKAKKRYDEIVIWYEYDVFCQINMLGYLNWIAENTDTKIGLVYSSKGLGRLAPEDYPILFSKRINVTDKLKSDCQSIWESLASGNLAQLESWSATYLPDLPNMSNALRCYQGQAFFDAPLKPLQQKVKWIIRSGTTNGKEIIGGLLQMDHIFGYGDYQFTLLLTSMTDELDFEPIIATNMDEFIDAVYTTDFKIR